MKVVLATWNGRISPVFDVARQVLLIEIEKGQIVRRQEEGLPGTDPFRQAERISELAPDVLICGAVSNPMAAALADYPVQVVPFVSGSADEVLAAWQAGNLPDPAWSMPGCCGRTRRCLGRAAGRQGGPGRRRGYGGRERHP